MTDMPANIALGRTAPAILGPSAFKSAHRRKGHGRLTRTLLPPLSGQALSIKTPYKPNGEAVFSDCGHPDPKSLEPQRMTDAHAACHLQRSSPQLRGHQHRGRRGRELGLAARPLLHLIRYWSRWDIENFTGLIHLETCLDNGESLNSPPHTPPGPSVGDRRGARAKGSQPAPLLVLPCYPRSKNILTEDNN
jgi:hypothetical protein